MHALEPEMRADLIITQRDIEAFLQTMMPIKIVVDEHRTLFLGRPRSVEIAPAHGIRMELSGRVRWTVIGIKLPITLTSVKLLAIPTLEQHGEMDVLVFRLHIEHADIKILPDELDETITAKVNAALRQDENAIVWDLRRTLDFRFPLPSVVAPASEVRLCALGANLAITDAAIVLSVELHAKGSSAYQPASSQTADECGV